MWSAVRPLCVRELCHAHGSDKGRVKLSLFVIMQRRVIFQNIERANAGLDALDQGFLLLKVAEIWRTFGAKNTAELQPIFNKPMRDMLEHSVRLDYLICITAWRHLR